MIRTFILFLFSVVCLLLGIRAELPPPSSTIVPPLPAYTASEPRTETACVAGERPDVVRHFQRGARSYTSSC